MTDSVFTARVNSEQYQQLIGRVDLFDETLFYTKYQKGKPLSAFEISPADLVTAFSGVPLSTGLLPRGCLFYARAGQDERIGLFLPAAVHTLTLAALGQRTQYTIPLPPLVFVGRGLLYSVHAVKQYPGTDEGLFRAPLPNVYNDGRICHGSVKFPKCSAVTIHKAAELFLSSDFNLDLSGDKSTSKRPLPDLWQDLHDKHAKKYPLDDLVGSRLHLRDLIGATDD